MAFAGAWGTPRNRYTRTTQGGQTGGMNAQGSVRSPQSVSGPQPAQRTSQPQQVQYGSFSAASEKKPAQSKPNPLTLDVGQAPYPDYSDARYARNRADLLAAFEQQQAQTVRDLATSRQRYREGRVGLGEQRGQGYDQLYQALGGSGFGRSGAVAQGGGQIQTDYQRGLAELSRQFGPKQQQLLRTLLGISAKQLQRQLQAESELAADRERQYILAGQKAPSFTPSGGIGELIPDDTRKNK